MSCSRAFSSASRTVTSFCARSSASRVVRPSFQSSCCRFRFWRARSRLARACSTDGARLLQRRLGGGDAGLAALQLAFERARIDLEQELAGLDALAFLDREPRDAAHGVRRDVDLTLRLDLARRRDDGFEVARAERFGVDAQAGVAPEVQVGRDDGGADHDDTNDDENLFPGHRISSRTRPEERDEQRDDDVEPEATWWRSGRCGACRARRARSRDRPSHQTRNKSIEPRNSVTKLVSSSIGTKMPRLAPAALPLRVAERHAEDLLQRDDHRRVRRRRRRPA